MKRKILTTTILTILSASTLPVIAQETNNIEVLSPVTVTANYNTGVADTVTITNKAINDGTTTSPRDLVRNIPGVELENQAIDGFTGFRIRGMGGNGTMYRTGQNRVAVDVDGVPLPDMFKTGHAVRTGVAPFATDDLKAVEVIRGPETSMSGKSGLAGTVKFVTKDPEDYYQKGKQFGGNVRTGYSSANKAFSIGTTVAGQFTDNLSAMISYNHSKSDEMPNYDKEKIYHDNGNFMARVPNFSPDLIDSADITTDSLMGKILFQPSDSQRITLKAEHSKRNFKANILPVGRKMAPVPKNPTDENTSKRSTISLRHNFNINTVFADDGYWQAHYQDYTNHRDNDLAYGTSFGTTDYKVKSYGIEANLSKTTILGNTEHTFSYGLNAQNSQSKVRLLWDAPRMFGGVSKATYQPDTKTKQITAYINDDISVSNGKLHIMPGVEFTHYKINALPTDNYAGTLTDKSDSHFSWRLGATYDINDNHQLFGGYRQGYKTPAFGELNSDVPMSHNRLPNPNLKPEQSAGLTLGLRSQGNIGSQTISAFYDTYKDLAKEIKVPTGKIGRYGPVMQAKTVNMDDKVVIYGVEYQGELDLHNAFNAPEGLKLRGSLAYAKGKNKQTNQPYSDVEPLNGSIGLGYDAPSKKWGMAVTTNFAKAKKVKDIAKSDKTLIPVKGYGVTDLTAYFKPTKGLQINAGVYNLFDKKYTKWSEAQYNSIFPQTYNQITEPGRFFGAKVKYDF